MIVKEFNNLCQEIRRIWTPHTGIVVLLSSFMKDDPLRLCVPPAQEAVEAEDCLLWDDEELVYKGKLTSEALRNKLTDLRVTGAIYRTWRQLDRPVGKFKEINAK